MENENIFLEKYKLLEAYFILFSFYGIFRMNNKFTVEN